LLGYAERLLALADEARGAVQDAKPEQRPDDISGAKAFEHSSSGSNGKSRADVPQGSRFGERQGFAGDIARPQARIFIKNPDNGYGNIIVSIGNVR
jgi:hypothetical protein